MTAILDPRTTETREPVTPAAPVVAAPAVVTPAPEPATLPLPLPVAPLPPAPPRERWVPTRSDMRRYGAAVFGLVLLTIVVQPAPDGPDPSRPVWVQVLDVVTTAGMLALLVGTLAGRRWTLWAGLAVGAPALAISLSCPISGHHEYAAWWGVQLAATVAMTALSVALLRRTRAS